MVISRKRKNRRIINKNHWIFFTTDIKIGLKIPKGLFTYSTSIDCISIDNIVFKIEKTRSRNLWTPLIILVEDVVMERNISQWTMQKIG